MNDSPCIERVESKKQLIEFVKFPFALYRDDPCWVPPFIQERLDFMDADKNPFFEHARKELFVARQAGRVVGTIAAVIDEYANQLAHEQVAGFGFFECGNDLALARALFQAAEGWAREQGMRQMRGPLNFSTNQECGLLVEGFTEPPMIMMTYNLSYYAELVLSQGYTKAMDLYAYIGDLRELTQNAPQKVYHTAARVLERKKIRVRKGDKRKFSEELELFRKVYESAWEQNWGFVPLTPREIDYLAVSLKQWIDPDFVLIAETEDKEPVGVSIALPDLHQALKRSGGGNLWPLGVPRFLWHRRHIDQIRVFAMGVVNEYRHSGIDAVFYLETAQTALAKGYRRVEGSWVLENNTMMNRLSERLGAKRYKTYRLYEKALV